uniref:Uncharacterized protein n=1 Tax=Astyanax mexicanus TaxID=7994 RepID=A0A8B9H5N4_ASTMX
MLLYKKKLSIFHSFMHMTFLKLYKRWQTDSNSQRSVINTKYSHQFLKYKILTWYCMTLQMVIYIESCNSGSMLEHLPSNVQVYGVSAADPNNPSCACYLDKVRHAYIADEFSAHWLLHCKMSDLTRTTFQNQFQYLRSQVKQSTPCQYGNNILCQRFISDFLGCPDSRTREAHARTAHTFKPTHLTASHEVPMVLLNMKIEKERDPTRKRALQRDYDNRQQVRNVSK